MKYCGALPQWCSKYPPWNHLSSTSHLPSVVPSHVVESSETMESLPEPSDTVDDEWAAMKIRFKKEGLAWDKLGQDDRLLQVLNILFTNFSFP